MAYATQEEVEFVCGGEERLKALTDVNDDGSLNTDVLALAQASADAWVNTFVNRRFETGVASPYPDALITLAAEETVYRLKSRKHGMVTADDKDRHLERLAWLESLVAGKVDLGVNPLPTKSVAVASKIIVRSEDDSVPVTRTKLGIF